MKRVDENNACPVCGRYKDGCLYAEDGNAAICVRTPEGAIKNTGNGWLHIFKKDFKPKPVKPKKKQKYTINWALLNDFYMKNLPGFYNPGIPYTTTVVKDLCNRWRVGTGALQAMQIGWSGRYFTFPVRNAEGKPIGLQRLFPDNSKKVVKHSQMGILIPRLNWDDLPDDWTLFICEGLSDTATAVDMGLRIIGRLTCGTGKDHIIKFCCKKKPSQIVIVADNDDPGIAGAKALGLWISQGYKLFTIPCPNIKVIVPPDGIKDLRAWVADGLNLEKFIQIVEKRLDFQS